MDVFRGVRTPWTLSTPKNILGGIEFFLDFDLESGPGAAPGGPGGAPAGAGPVPEVLEVVLEA